MQLILSHHLSLTSCWASPQPQHVWKKMSFHICIQSQTCSFDIREDAPNHMTGLLQFLYWHGFLLIVSEELSYLLPVVFWGCFSLRQSLPSNLVRERTIVLLVSDHRTSLPCTSLSWLELHESPFEHCPCAYTPTFLSTWAFCPVWLLVTAPLATTSFRSLKFRILISWSIWILTEVFNLNNVSAHFFERFLGRTKPRRSEAEQNPAILTCTILPGSHLWEFRSLIIELCPIERRNLGRRHSVSVFWTNLRVFVPLLWLHRNARRSWKQFVSLVRIGRVSEHADSFLEVNVHVEKLFQCRRSHRIKHVEVREICSLHKSIAMSQVRQLILLSQLIWSSALWDEDLLISNKLQSWNWLFSFEIP